MPPLNQSGSVRTEITLAPARAYCLACAAALMSRANTPFEGDARLMMRA